MSEVNAVVQVENKKLSKTAKVGLGIGGVLLAVGAGFGIKKLMTKKPAPSMVELNDQIDEALEADKASKGEGKK